MHAQSTSNAELDVLRKIQRTAVDMLELLSSSSQISKPTPFLDTSILPPHDISPIMKLPEGTRLELLGCFTNRLNEQQRFLSSFRSAFSIIRNTNDMDAVRNSKHQRKSRSGKKTFNNVSTYGCPHVCVPPTAILGIYALT